MGTAAERIEIDREPVGFRSDERRAPALDRLGGGIARGLALEAVRIDDAVILEALGHAVGDKAVGGVLEGVAEQVDVGARDLGVVAHGQDLDARAARDGFRARRRGREERADDDLRAVVHRLAGRRGAALGGAAGRVDAQVDLGILEIPGGELGCVDERAAKFLAARIAGAGGHQERNRDGLERIDVDAVARHLNRPPRGAGCKRCDRRDTGEITDGLAKGGAGWQHERSLWI